MDIQNEEYYRENSRLPIKIDVYKKKLNGIVFRSPNFRSYLQKYTVRAKMRMFYQRDNSRKRSTYLTVMLCKHVFSCFL